MKLKNGMVRKGDFQWSRKAVDARRTGLNISETYDWLRYSDPAISTLDEKITQKALSERQFTLIKNLFLMGEKKSLRWFKQIKRQH